MRGGSMTGARMYERITKQNVERGRVWVRECRGRERKVGEVCRGGIYIICRQPRRPYVRGMCFERVAIVTRQCSLRTRDRDELLPVVHKKRATVAQCNRGHSRCHRRQCVVCEGCISKPAALCACSRNSVLC
jgi:hypothetical protein